MYVERDKMCVMVDTKRSWQWLCLLIFGLMFFKANGVYVSITILQSTKAKGVSAKSTTETATIKLKKEEIEGPLAKSVAESIAQYMSECGFEAKRRVLGLGIGENVNKLKERKEKKKMKAVALSPSFITSSLTTSATAAAEKRSSATTCLSYASHNNFSVSHLAAFREQSHLFTKSPSRPIAYTKSRARKSASGIFLPHLVASLEQVEQTYVMVKPDGVQRGLVGEIISRFERKGFKLTGLKLFQCPKELAEEHYRDLSAKPFYPSLIDYITSGPVVCMAWEGVGVVASARKLIGATNPLQAEPGTIRGDLAVQTGRNVIHGSDSPENGKRETGLWFKDGELCEWTPAQAEWLWE